MCLTGYKLSDNIGIMKIIKRTVISQIKQKKYLENDEILLLTGARQVGKTTILKLLQKEIENKKGKTFFINLEDPDYLSLLNQSPKNLFEIFPIDLKTRTFVFIDEVQYLNNPTNFLKYLYDEYKGKIKLIVSGSSAFYLDKKFKDSLAGRKIIIPVRTLSFRELLLFKGEERLFKLLPEKFDSENYKLEKELTLSEKEKIKKYFNEFILFGGYPRVVLASSPADKISILQDIAYSYIKKDVYDANIRQDETFYRLFKVLASQVGGLVNTNELSKSLRVSRKTIENHLYIMQKSFHISLIRPFYANVRKELRKMSKVFFYDCGLRNFFVNNFTSPLLRIDKGQLLENAVFRQLAERSGILTNEKIKYWRTQAGAEVDFIFEEKFAFEVKFTTSLFKEKKYRLFFENYPKIKFNLVALETTGEEKYPVWKPWWL